MVFIGPCTAKKAEAKRETVKPWVDCVLTFEELQALLDCRDFDVSQLPVDVLDNASYFGRIFAAPAACPTPWPRPSRSRTST